MKNLLKKCILFLGFLSFLACNTDDSHLLIQKTIPLTQKLKITEISGQDLSSSNPKAYNQLVSLGQNSFRNSQYSEEYNFYYNLENIQLIETNSYKQYSILVESSNQQSNQVLNYSLKYYHDAQEPKQFLTTYYFELDENLNYILNTENSHIEYLNGNSIFSRISCPEGSVPMLVDITQEPTVFITPCTGGENHTNPDRCPCNQPGYNCEPPQYSIVYQTVYNYGCSGGGNGNSNSANTPETGGGASNDNVDSTIPLLPNPKSITQIKNQLNAIFGEHDWDDDFVNQIYNLIQNDPDISSITQAVDKIVTNGIEDVPCLINIYNDLGGSETFSQMLSSFDGEGSIADLRFRTGDSIDIFDNSNDVDNWNATAITRKIDNSNLIEIVFNTSDLLDTSISNYPDAVLALIFVHEVIHAEMYRQLLVTLGSNSDNFNQVELDDYLIFDNNLLFDLYINKITNGTDPHHKLMAYKYRQKIKEALSEYNISLTEDQKEAISWLGLEGTFAHTLAWADNPNLQSQSQSALQQILENGNYECNE